MGPANEPSPSLAYNLREAAAALRIGRTKTLELIHSGQLRHVRVGRKIIVPKTAIEDFLRQEVGATA